MAKTVPIVLMAALGLLGGCETVRAARDRIVRTPPACQSESVPIYFETGAADLTREGRSALLAAASRTRGCMVKGVRVVGLADAAGDPNANLELSRRRADAVAAAIAAAGLPAATFDLAAAGQAGALTPDGRAAPLRRRADVTIDLEKPKAR